MNRLIAERVYHRHVVCHKRGFHKVIRHRDKQVVMMVAAATVSIAFSLHRASELSSFCLGFERHRGILQSGLQDVAHML